MRLVYLSPVPWSSFTQRPHAFVRWAHARTGAEVLWLDPYPTRLPVLSDLWSPRGSRDLGEGVPGWLTVAAPRAFPVEPAAGFRLVNQALWAPLVRQVARFAGASPTTLVVGKPSRLALHLMDRIRFAYTVYDAMDAFAAFYKGVSASAMADTERRLAGRVDTMMVSSTALFDRWSATRPVTLVRNACAVEPQSTANKQAAGAPVVLGYVGTIAGWFDWALTAALAEAAPDARVEIVGPMHAAPPRSMPANVVLRGVMRHDEAMAAMRGFSVGVIPFLLNRLTDAVDPVKYYEYRALGLPVVSSAFGEMRFHGRAPGVFLVDGDHEGHGVASAITAALAYRDGDDERQGFARANTWDARFDACGVFQDL